MSAVLSLPALRPMVSSLLRHRLMPLLLLGQIVLACAILTNVAFLLLRQLDPMLIDDGIVRNEVLLVDQLMLQNARWTTAQSQALQQALKSIPGVRVFAPTMGLPMRQTMSFSMALRSPAGVEITPTGFAGDGLVQALGMELVQGRDFNADDYVIGGGMFNKGAQGIVPVILTQALSDKFFPDGHALGGRLDGGDEKSQYVVVGIVRHLLRYELAELDDGHAEESLVYPMRDMTRMPRMAYAVRTGPAQREAVKAAIPGVIQREFGPQLMRDIPTVVETYERVRGFSFKQRRAAAWLLGSVCAVVALITLIGIASLTGYWIEQRTRQIGIRRALGATRAQVLRHFHVENLLLTALGLLLGLPLAYAVNQWLMQHYELPRLPLLYLPIGAALLLILGQCAVLWPARRAAAIAPAIATRAA